MNSRSFLLLKSRALIINCLHFFPGVIIPVLKGGIKVSKLMGPASGLTSIASPPCRRIFTALFFEQTRQKETWVFRELGLKMSVIPELREPHVDVHRSVEACL